MGNETLHDKLMSELGNDFSYLSVKKNWSNPNAKERYKLELDREKAVIEAYESMYKRILSVDFKSHSYRLNHNETANSKQLFLRFFNHVITDMDRSNVDVELR